MEGDVEKGEQTEHAPEADEVGEVEQSAERSDRKGDEQEAESPVSGEVLNKFDGICAEPAVISAGGEEAEGREAEQKNADFGTAAEENLA
jgi:hypothetical protein